MTQRKTRSESMTTHGTLNDSTAERIAKTLARKPILIHIAVNGVWSADLEGGACLFSYEKLDYHSDTRAFLEGLRDAGIPFVYHGSITL
jgi:ribosomal protein L18